jgi:hypothetical protein
VEVRGFEPLTCSLRTNRKSKRGRVETGTQVVYRLLSCQYYLRPCFNSLTSDAEYNLDTARIYVDKDHNEKDTFTVIMGWNYKIGQFCFCSARMIGKMCRQSIKDALGEDYESERDKKNNRKIEKL